MNHKKVEVDNTIRIFNPGEIGEYTTQDTSKSDTKGCEHGSYFNGNGTPEPCPICHQPSDTRGCEKCGRTSDVVDMSQCPFCRQPSDTVGEVRGLADWIDGNIGVSSKAIYLYMAKGIEPRPFDAPSDGGDRERCAVLLRAMPEWIERLSEIEALHITGTSNGEKVEPWNEQIPLILQALTNLEKKKE
jgi:hypothetical protein